MSSAVLSVYFAISFAFGLSSSPAPVIVRRIFHCFILYLLSLLYSFGIFALYECATLLCRLRRARAGEPEKESLSCFGRIKEVSLLSRVEFSFLRMAASGRYWAKSRSLTPNTPVAGSVNSTAHQLPYQSGSIHLCCCCALETHFLPFRRLLGTRSPH